MHTYLTYAGEDVRISMAMTIGKFKLNFLIVLWTITFLHNYAVKFIHRPSANLLKTVFLCQFLEHIELPYSPKNLEILEDLYQQVSHSCTFEVECQCVFVILILLHIFLGKLYLASFTHRNLLQIPTAASGPFELATRSFIVHFSICFHR